jgi:hypothetical protein
MHVRTHTTNVTCSRKKSAAREMCARRSCVDARYACAQASYRHVIDTHDDNNHRQHCDNTYAQHTSPSSSGAEYRPNLSSSDARSRVRQKRSLAWEDVYVCVHSMQSDDTHLPAPYNQVEHVDDHVVVIEQVG